MKTYNQTNFFKHTFCEFQQIEDFDFPKKTHYQSKSESAYFYTEEGVYRRSTHWGRVANCRWKFIANKDYKNQTIGLGFAKWTDFYPIETAQKIFYIEVDYESKTATIRVNTNSSSNHCFVFYEAQQKRKQIIHLLNNDKWAQYYEQDIEELRFNIISEYIQSKQSLQQIKRNYR